jgi:hypothetical protein
VTCKSQYLQELRIILSIIHELHSLSRRSCEVRCDRLLKCWSLRELWCLFLWSSAAERTGREREVSIVVPLRIKWVLLLNGTALSSLSSTAVRSSTGLWCCHSCRWSFVTRCPWSDLLFVLPYFRPLGLWSLGSGVKVNLSWPVRASIFRSDGSFFLGSMSLNSLSRQQMEVRRDRLLRRWSPRQLSCLFFGSSVAGIAGRESVMLSLVDCGRRSSCPLWLTALYRTWPVDSYSIVSWPSFTLFIIYSRTSRNWLSF